MIVSGMSRDRLAAALAEVTSPDLRGGRPPIPPALKLLASGTVTSREDRELLARLARRQAAEHRFRGVTQRYKRRLCAWALCPHLADATGLCHHHWRQGRRMANRAAEAARALAGVGIVVAGVPSDAGAIKRSDCFPAAKGKARGNVPVFDPGCPEARFLTRDGQTFGRDWAEEGS